MTDCGQLKELYELFALGVLDPEEHAELKAHLGRGCPACTAGIERARWVVSQLAFLAPDADPPSVLRKKVLEAVGKQEKSRPTSAIPFWAWAAAAALVLLTVFSAYQTRRIASELARLETELENAHVSRQELQASSKLYEAAVAVLSAPDTRTVKLVAKERSLPDIDAHWSQERGLVLTGRSVPSPPTGRDLQLWVVPKTGSPISAGVFRPGSSGTLLVVSFPIAKIADAAAVAISEEPAGGLPQPTLDKIRWVGPIT